MPLGTAEKRTIAETFVSWSVMAHFVLKIAATFPF